jgi:cardiolipin synthase
MKRYLALLCVVGAVFLVAIAVAGGSRGQAGAFYGTPSNVVINEVEYDPSQAGNDSAWEWFEIYNNTALPVTITNWIIEDNNGSDAIPSLVLPPGGLAVVAATMSFYDNYPGFAGTIVFLDGTIGNGLSSAGDRLILKDDGGQVMDALSYEGDTTILNCGGYPCASLPAGHSLERFPRGYDTDGPGDFIDQYPPTPGSGLEPPPPTADLRLDKLGPANVLAGALITYTIVISNAGQLPAQATWLTDVLPAQVEFVAHTAPYPFSQPVSGTLVWDLGTVPTITAAAPITFTVTGRIDQAAASELTNVITATSATPEASPADNNDRVTTLVGSEPVTPLILIEALYYDTYESGQPDEAVRVMNVSTVTADLGGWDLNDGSSSVATFPPGTTLAPGQALWSTDEALAFERQFGFKPDFETGDTDPAVPEMGGSWPGFADAGDECLLKNEPGDIVDTLVYKAGDTQTAGWRGSAVQPWTSGSSFAASGQILYRKRDQATGRPVADTGTAADWAQDPADQIDGRKVLYPGWDLDAFFFTRRVSETASLTVALAPDNLYAAVAPLLTGAQESIRIETYSFKSRELTDLLLERISHGVSVSLLLEGAPAFEGVTDEGRWVARQLADAGAQVLFMVNDSENDVHDRYDNQHAKIIVVDGTWALVGSENLNNTSFAADDMANGTAGRRGVYLITDAPGVVARFQAILDADADPAHHPDVVGCDQVPALCSPPSGFEPGPTPDWVTYTVQFPAPLTTQGVIAFEVIQSPESSLRSADSLLGLVGRAGPGDALFVEQFYEFSHWGPAAGTPETDPNLRLQAYLDAARRGASVRLLLDSHFDDAGDNAATLTYLKTVAQAEGLDLQARLADPTYLGLHNKMVLARIDGQGWVHAGSINGSEASSKVNREVALQVQSDAAYDYLRAVFDYDWVSATPPLYLPLVVKNHVAPQPADHLLVSEVYYPSTLTSPERQWVELYNPTSQAVDISAFKIGDAANLGDFEGMYRFPPGAMVQPHHLLVVAVSATHFAAEYPGLLPDFEILDSHPAVPNLSKYAAWGEGDWWLRGAGDEVVLLDGNDLPVDVVAYGDSPYTGVVPHPGVEYGHSLERYPVWLDTDDCSVDFRDWPYPNPGELP